MKMEPARTSNTNTANERLTFGLLFVKRFFRLQSRLFPSWRSLPVLVFILLLCLGLLEQVVIYNIGLVPSKYIKVLNEKDSSGFYKETGLALIFIVTEAFIKGTTIFITSLLYLTWRKTVTQSLHKDYFKDVLYYTLNVVDKTVDNPDQRITQDVDKLCNTLSQIVVPVIISPFTIGYYIYQTSKSSGYIGPLSVFGFFVVATVVNKLLMSPVVEYVFRQERMEGNFRFKHMQMRVNAEPAAFYRSGMIENMKTDDKLEKLLNTQHRLIRREYALNFSINLFDYLGSILSYLALSIPVFAGAYDDMSAADLSALISKNSFVMIYLINCFTRLIDLAAKATDVAGTTHRVVELMEVLGQLRDEQENRRLCRPSTVNNGFGWDEMSPLIDPSPALSRSETDDARIYSDAGRQKHARAFTLDNVTYRAPKAKEVLCKGLSFQFETGVNILVTGDSGCGKSSLLRVINGLWPEIRGKIEHGIQLGPHTLLFLPQKPYFTDGSLRQQVLYPLQEFDSDGKILHGDDELVYRYLDLVGLNHLVDRIGGLDITVDWNWYDELSPGEMQRLSFVRLFYHKPLFAVLDEATSQIGFEAERQMYQTCSELGITVLSVGHRDSLRQYHHIDLHLDGKGGWLLRPITDGTISANS